MDICLIRILEYLMLFGTSRNHIIFFSYLIETLKTFEGLQSQKCTKSNSESDLVSFVKKSSWILGESDPAGAEPSCNNDVAMPARRELTLRLKP